VLIGVEYYKKNSLGSKKERIRRLMTTEIALFLLLFVWFQQQLQPFCFCCR